MEFLKRNILLTSVAVVTLAGSILLIVAIARTGKANTQMLAAMAEQRDFLASLRTHNFAITDSNSLSMAANRAMLENELKRLSKMLATNFAVPRTELQAVEFLMRLRQEISTMQQDLAGKNITVTPTYFSFQQVATTVTLPSEETVVTLLRQVHVIRELMRILGNSLAASNAEVRQAGDAKPTLAVLDRLSGDEFIARADYEFMPLRLRIEAPLDKVQAFVNLLNTEAKYLFFIREIALQSKDQTQSLQLPKASAPATLPSGPTDFDPLQLGTRPKAPAPVAEVQVLPLRERVVFKPHWVTADIRIDFVQFKTTDQES